MGGVEKGQPGSLVCGGGAWGQRWGRGLCPRFEGEFGEEMPLDDNLRGSRSCFLGPPLLPPAAALKARIRHHCGQWLGEVKPCSCCPPALPLEGLAVWPQANLSPNAIHWFPGISQTPQASVFSAVKGAAVFAMLPRSRRPAAPRAQGVLHDSGRDRLPPRGVCAACASRAGAPPRAHLRQAAVGQRVSGAGPLQVGHGLWKAVESERGLFLKTAAP